uniref:Ubiquitin-like protease family profile domain-containing protein n=1 Tax=Cladonia uncialis subsp. uncialis TaxID=180999 RepID=A0A2K9YE78_CLAUC|nr:hypothetical protein [Cladonia uncialis subsp. uncialis]
MPASVTCRQITLNSIEDPTLLFQRARTELLAAVKKSQQWRDECAVTVTRIWESVQNMSYQDASLSPRVQEWQQNIISALPKGEIDNQLRLAKQYLQRLDSAQKRILDAWGLTPNELLTVGSYFPSSLSQTMWRGLAEISETVTLEEAKTLLVQKMHDRLNAEHHGHGWRADRWLLPQDLKATKKDLEKNKVSRAAIERQTPQDFDIPSITENLKQNRNTGDGLDFRHDLTRAKRRKRNHDPDRAFDGRLVASRSTTKSDLDGLGLRSHEESSIELARRGNMESDLDGRGDENGPDIFGDESNGNSSEEPFDYSIDEIMNQERIVPLTLAPKLPDPTSKSSSYMTLNLDEIDTPLLPNLSTSRTGLDNTILDPQRSKGAATPSETTTAPRKPVIKELVSYSFQSSSSPQLVERSIGSKSLLGPNCTSRNAIVSEIAAEGLSLPIDTSEKATGDINLPSTDLQGALSSLQPRCWLSSTAIELVLSLCPRKSFRVFDPLAYDIGKPEIRNIKPIPNDVQYALLPLYHREHWILALFDLKNYTITCYDSLPGQNTIAHRDALLKFANNLKIETFQWTFQHGSQAKQDNLYDCGVFVLISSLHILAGSICPPFYDCSLWRALFRALLTIKCQTELPVSSTRVEDENDDPDSIKKTFLSHKQLQEEAKSGAEAASKAIDVLQRLQIMNIKLRDDGENNIRVAQTDLTTIDQVVSAYHTLRPQFQTDIVTRGLQTNRGHARAEAERLKIALEAAEKRINSCEAAIQTALKTRNYHAEAEAQSRERMKCKLQDLDILHNEQIKAAERSALVKEQLSNLLK